MQQRLMQCSANRLKYFKMMQMSTKQKRIEDFYCTVCSRFPVYRLA